MADDWVTIQEPEAPIAGEWETITEQAPLPVRAAGAFAKGTMRLAGALIDLPKHIVNQVKLLPMAGMADEVLAAKDPKVRAAKLADMAKVENFFGTLTKELGKAGEIHRAGQETILKNHPEWESDPPESFVDLVTSPDKLVVALAESTPLLLGAGIMTAAGMPQVGVMMMYASEGQEAYDRAKAAGQSDDVADDAYIVYGTVAAALEQMQLQGIMKIGKGMFNRVLNRTAQKVGRQGIKAMTMDVIKSAAKEALEEATQGTWGDVTAKIIYNEPFGELGEFIDRRAQEAYIGFMMGVIPGAGGAVAGKAQQQVKKFTAEVEAGKKKEAKSAVEPVTGGKVVLDTRQDYLKDNRTGKDKILYHATYKHIKKFLPRVGRDIGVHLAASPEQAQNRLEDTAPKKYKGIHTKTKQEGANIIPVKVTLKNPYNVVADLGDWGDMGMLYEYFGNPENGGILAKEWKQGKITNQAEFVIEMTKKGYDGIQYDNSFEGEIGKAGSEENQAYIVFQPAQIYSSISGKGLGFGEVAQPPAAEAVTPDEAIGKQYGITPTETQERLGKAELRYRELKTKPTEQRSTEEKKELAFLSRNRKNIEAILERETQPLEPKRMTKRKALALGHKIPYLLSWSEDQRRGFNEKITGKRSMKDMVPAQREQVVLALQREAEAAGVEVAGPDPTPVSELSAKLRERKQKPALTRRDRRNMKRMRKLYYTMKSGTNYAFLQLSRIKRLSRSLDNYEDNGPFMRYIYQPVKDADTKANVNFTETMGAAIATMNDLGIDAPAMMLEVKDIGIKDKLSTAERIGIWALAQNEKTKKHLLSEFSEGEIKKVTDSVEASENEMLVAAEIQTYFEQGWAQFQAVAEANGIKGVVKEENYITAFVTDKNDLSTPDFTEGLMQQFTEGTVVPGKQHTIERKKGAMRNLELNIFVIHARAARALERFKIMAPVANEVGSMLGNKNFKQAINDATYGHGSRVFDRWLQDSVRGQAAYDSSAFAKSLRWLRMSSVHYVLGFKILTAAKQGISFLPAMAVHPSMIPAVFANLERASVGLKYKQMRNNALEKSELVRTRDWNRDLRQVYNQKSIKKMYAGKKLSPISMRMATNVDQFTVTVVWTSAYQVAQRHNMNEEDSIKFADGVIENTQPMGKAVDLPNFFRGSELQKNLSTFQNQVNQNGNILWYDILGETKARKIGIPMMSYRLLMGQIAPAMLLGMVSRGRPPESVGDVVKDLLFYFMTPFSFVGRWAYNVATGEYGPTSWIAETPFIETKRLGSAIRRGETKNIIKYGARTIGAWSGGKIPLQAIQTAEGAWNIVTEEDPDFRELVWSKYALRRKGGKQRKKLIY